MISTENPIANILLNGERLDFLPKIRNKARVPAFTSIQCCIRGPSHWNLEKEMATHSSVLAWRIPGMGEPWWAAIYGVAQSWTRLKRLSSSSSSLWATGALGCTNLSPTWDSQSLDLETWGAILALLLGSLTTLTLGLSRQSEEVRF